MWIAVGQWLSLRAVRATAAPHRCAVDEQLRCWRSEPTEHDPLRGAAGVFSPPCPEAPSSPGGLGRSCAPTVMGAEKKGQAEKKGGEKGSSLDPAPPSACIFDGKALCAH